MGIYSFALFLGLVSKLLFIELSCLFILRLSKSAVYGLLSAIRDLN